MLRLAAGYFNEPWWINQDIGGNFVSSALEISEEGVSAFELARMADSSVASSLGQAIKVAVPGLWQKRTKGNGPKRILSQTLIQAQEYNERSGYEPRIAVMSNRYRYAYVVVHFWSYKHLRNIKRIGLCFNPDFDKGRVLEKQFEIGGKQGDPYKQAMQFLNSSSRSERALGMALLNALNTPFVESRLKHYKVELGDIFDEINNLPGDAVITHLGYYRYISRVLGKRAVHLFPLFDDSDPLSHFVQVHSLQEYGASLAESHHLNITNDAILSPDFLFYLKGARNLHGGDVFFFGSSATLSPDLLFRMGVTKIGCFECDERDIPEIIDAIEKGDRRKRKSHMRKIVVSPN